MIKPIDLKKLRIPDEHNLPTGQIKLVTLNGRLAKVLSDLGLDVPKIETHCVKGMSIVEVEKLAKTLLTNQCAAMIQTIKTYNNSDRFQV